MNFEEYIERFKEEFKSIEDMIEVPTDRELVLMFINNVVLMEFQKSELDKEIERERREWK